VTAPAACPLLIPASGAFMAIYPFHVLLQTSEKNALQQLAFIRGSENSLLEHEG